MDLFLDTETTGMVLFREARDHPQQPRIVQLGAILCNEQRRVVAEMNFLVKPEGWVIPEEASRIHGITTEMCEAHGLKLGTVLKLFMQLVRRSKRVVAHNFPFDQSMVHIELLRLKYDEELAAFLVHESACTMALSTPILKLPGRYGDYKWPNLQEAHQHFIGRPFEGAHDAMADVRACRDVYYAMNPIKPSEISIS